MIETNQSYRSNKETLFAEPISTNDGLGTKFRICDTLLTHFIRKAYFDDTKSRILTLFDEPFSVEQVLQKIVSPQSSIYKKHRELVNDGFLVHVGYTQNNKSTMLYERIFSEISTTIIDNILKIEITLNQKALSHYAKNNKLGETEHDF